MTMPRNAFIVLFALASVAAYADDLVPPPWRLSNASATVQEWDFTSSTQPLAPDGLTWGSGGGGYVNTNGVPQFLSTNGTWYSALNGGFGVWEINGGQSMDFVIPNDGPTNDPKTMWIQLTSLAPGTTLLPSLYIGSFSYTGPATFVSSFLDTTGWTHSMWSVSMSSCPPFERINIFNGTPVAIDVSEMVVDTICKPVPEPASMLALGVGIVGLISRRRRKVGSV